MTWACNKNRHQTHIRTCENLKKIKLCSTMIQWILKLILIHQFIISYFQWSWVLFDAFSGNRALAITYSKPVTAGINCRKRGGVKTWFSKQATAIQKHPTAEINIFKINFSNLKTNCLALIEFLLAFLEHCTRPSFGLQWMLFQLHIIMNKIFPSLFYFHWIEKAVT